MVRICCAYLITLFTKHQSIYMHLPIGGTAKAFAKDLAKKGDERLGTMRDKLAGSKGV